MAVTIEARTPQEAAAHAVKLKELVKNPLVRMAIESLVLAFGWMLGGTIGVGTVAYALSNGPLLQIFLPMFEIRPQTATAPAPSPT